MAVSVHLTEDELLGIMGGKPLNDRGPFGLTIKVDALARRTFTLTISVTDKAMLPVGEPVFRAQLCTGDTVTIENLAKLFHVSVSTS